MKAPSAYGADGPAPIRREPGLAWLSAVGVGVWFVVGFPFGNHNESYYWVARFEQESIWDITWTRTLAATFRPGGQSLAYIGWWMSQGESWPVQLLNFGLAACALWASALAVRATRTFVLAAAVGGGVFFTGYIYLFHLHGVFYSPVLLLIAALLHLRRAGDIPEWLRDVAAWACSVAVGLLFHPYGLIIFLGYLGGVAIERWSRPSYRGWLRVGLLGALAVFALLANRPQWHRALSGDNVRAFLASYAFVEITPGISALAGVFAIATVLGIEDTTRRRRLAFAAAALVGSAMAYLAGFPVTLVWVAMAAFKMAYLAEWALVGMMASAAMLPAIATSGSPTYTIFVLLMSTVALAWGCAASEHALQRIDRRWIAAGVLMMVTFTGALRMGVEVPVFSEVARPLVAERERTRQLESVIEWMLASEYRGWQLTLEESANPVDVGRGAIDRRRRPPTYQPYLDAYLDSQRPSGTVDDGQSLLVSFGTAQRENRTLVKSVPGRYAGEARVFK